MGGVLRSSGPLLASDPGRGPFCCRCWCSPAFWVGYDAGSGPRRAIVRTVDCLGAALLRSSGVRSPLEPSAGIPRRLPHILGGGPTSAAVAGPSRRGRAAYSPNLLEIEL